MSKDIDPQWRAVSSYVLAAEPGERRDTIMDVLQTAKLKGYAGYCFVAAIAINRVLLGGKGELVGACNSTVMTRTGRFIGHMTVRFDNTYWDADGEPKSVEDIESWGMLDPQDPDFEGEYSEEECSAVTIRVFDEQSVLALAHNGDHVQAWEDDIARAVGKCFDMDEKGTE